jgi:hypothetical protein
VHQSRLAINHMLKDCELLKRMLGQPSKRKDGDRDKEAPKDHGAPPKDGSSFPNVDGYLMIFGGPEDDYSKRQHKSDSGKFAPPGMPSPSSSISRAHRSPSTGVTMFQASHDLGATRLLSTPSSATSA